MGRNVLRSGEPSPQVFSTGYVEEELAIDGAPKYIDLDPSGARLPNP